MSAVQTREHPALRRDRLAALGPLGKPVNLILVGAAVFLLIGCLSSQIFAQQTVVGLAQGAVYGSLALALVLIYRATEVVNFAQGEMAMFTTYVAYQLTTSWHVTYWLAFALTLLIAFVFGMGVQLVFIRPVQHTSVIAVVIVTVGLFILIDGVVGWVWGADIKFMPAPFGNTVYHVGGVAIARQDIGTILVTIASVGLLWLLFQRTKLGLGMRAAALRPASARLVGVRVDRMLALGWGLAAVLGAVAGLMAEASEYSLQPSFMQPILLYAFAAAVLGGLESPVGALVGGVMIGIFLNLLGQYVSFVTSEIRLPFAFLVLIVVLLIKPTGLFGKKKVRKV
ncbi:MAG: branched-chain amino acid ABC transporter permease [Actinobacteria bacterium]|nr:branched-chain amino acid ABC transporter permease [Actinomycetota bacterium]MBV8561567.1 branched-chain amino acid ABC transporter permease [Actinomycetota bacterium]